MIRNSLKEQFLRSHPENCSLNVFSTFFQPSEKFAINLGAKMAKQLPKAMSDAVKAVLAGDLTGPQAVTAYGVSYPTLRKHLAQARKAAAVTAPVQRPVAELTPDAVREVARLLEDLRVAEEALDVRIANLTCPVPGMPYKSRADLPTRYTRPRLALSMTGASFEVLLTVDDGAGQRVLGRAS